MPAYVIYFYYIVNKYLLLTVFEVHTASYGPRFFLLFFLSRAGHKSQRNKRGSLAYSTDRENEVTKISLWYLWVQIEG